LAEHGNESPQLIVTWDAFAWLEQPEGPEQVVAEDEQSDPWMISTDDK
jgi:hypothetical protein